VPSILLRFPIPILYSAGQVSEVLGFPTLASFSNFKRLTGLSPKAFRAQAR